MDVTLELMWMAEWVGLTVDLRWMSQGNGVEWADKKITFLLFICFQSDCILYGYEGKLANINY